MELGLHTSTPLTTGWTIKQGDRSSTNPHLPAHDAPTEVHRDLLKNEKIKDPFKDLDELSARWVGDETWTYRTTFSAPISYGRSGVTTELRFEGLDTFASVYLNGSLILESDNMFVEYRVDIAGKLKDGDNSLEIVFHSARKKGLELVKAHQEHRFIVHQTEISRGPVRKAQYHWGWDWGPILMTSGIWKPVSLETWSTRISNLVVNYELSNDLEFGKMTVSVDWEGSFDHVAFTVTNGGGVVKWRATINAESGVQRGTAKAHFDMENVELWWPRGYGIQNMYTVQAEAFVQSDASESLRLHSISREFGFRRVELVQEPDEYGKSFHLRVNNIDIFCGGSCWIPADSLLTRLTSADYYAWVKLAADGNQTMLRVWGGGIYEADALYDAADKLGVLIWQDFMFACANYPAHLEYLKSVETEARQNVRRLRNHPSIVLWAGNNEDYQIVERYGLQYDQDDQDPDSWLKTNFPARFLYEYLLPMVVSEECSNVAYHPSSPFGNGRSTVLKVDPTIGDVHQWNVWHGTMEPYQKLPEMGGRFVSEFGMEAYPHVSTIESCTRKEDRYPGSMAMDFHNKAIGHERRLISYVAENFRIRDDLEGFTHLTQVMQADAMSWAYRSWRRDWNSPGNRKCGGVLVWQLNDCWPTMSWAVVDYHRVPKPAYYAIKRAMQPVTINVQRKNRSWTMRPADKLWQRDTGHIDMRRLWQQVEYDVWVANNTTDEMRVMVYVCYISIKTGLKMGPGLGRDMVIAANGTTEIDNRHLADVNYSQPSEEPFDYTNSEPFVIQAVLEVPGRRIASDVSWPEPIKYLSFEDRGVKVQYSEDFATALVSAAKPVKGFVFSETKGVHLSDNGFDIMPGETYQVQISGCNTGELKWMYIGM